MSAVNTTDRNAQLKCVANHVTPSHARTKYQKSGSRYVSSVFAPAGRVNRAHAVFPLTSQIQYSAIKIKTLAPMLYKHHVGVARIFDIPSGVSSHPDTNAINASTLAGKAFCRNSGHRFPYTLDPRLTTGSQCAPVSSRAGTAAGNSSPSIIDDCSSRPFWVKTHTSA
jgi:hypothetical protein